MKLSEIATVITKGTTPTTLGFQYRKEGINFIKIESITEDGDFLQERFGYIDSDCYAALKRSQLQENDILFSIAGAIGRVAIVDNSILPANVNQALAIIRIPKGKLNFKFLFYILKSKMIKKQYEVQKQGVAQSNISLRNIGEFEIPSIEIEKQNRIVFEIEQIESLRKKRKQQLEKLDLLVKANFYEMFGDRLYNNKGWQIKPLSECTDFYNGKAHEQVIDNNGKYILVTSRCIASDFLDYRKTNVQLFPLRKNDIVMVMSDVPNGKAFAKCQIIDKDDFYTLNQRICCFRNYKFNPTFFFWLLNRHEYFLQFDNGDSQTNLRKNELLACSIILPPKELQDEFAHFVERTEKTKSKIKQSLEKLELLKQSLLQKYFG